MYRTIIVPVNGSTRSHGAPAGSDVVVVTHQRGMRFAARIRSHEVVTDQTLRGGGEDEAPTPLELIGAALGSCIALYVRKFLLARHLPTEPLRVDVAQQTALKPHRIARFDVLVVLSDAVPLVYRPMIEAVARVCPVHNTLACGSNINVVVEFEQALASSQ